MPKEIFIFFAAILFAKTRYGDHIREVTVGERKIQMLSHGSSGIDS